MVVDLEESQESESIVAEMNQEMPVVEIIDTKKSLEEVPDLAHTMIVINVMQEQVPAEKSATISAPQWLETSVSNKKRNVVPAPFPIEDMPAERKSFREELQAMLLMGIVALFTLGDSIVDPGNNNYLPTIAKGNHPRYGQDFTDKRPTSRLSNGKLTTHFRAASLGLEDMLPAYLELDLKTQDFLTDVSFASAGTGYDNLIVMSYSVIPMWKQVEMFKECKACLEDTVGKEKSSNIIEKALFLMVAGTIDFIMNYLSLPIRRNELNVEQY
ncbi:GDSL esterase/lipase At2g04570-like [Cryptomeria japonica]|uniref:GDSL esterase/lipase At2g04570-like n=1 Tax=Cryptomeria japonica TaxID=3369 RepID=UPI0027DA4433|nr:GDSL esterase/lipase At2g04570-like [Cryptomeria japonica]